MALGLINCPAFIRNRKSPPLYRYSDRRNTLPECPASDVERFRGGPVHFREIVRRQLYLDAAEVFLQTLEFARAGDRHNPGFLREQPGERDLCRRRLLACSDAGE